MEDAELGKTDYMAPSTPSRFGAAKAVNKCRCPEAVCSKTAFIDALPVARYDSRER